ncbi:MAG: hypothetical protein WC619_00110 [Patescibacteria group bacterium]
MEKGDIKQFLKIQLKKLGYRAFTTIVLTLTAIATVWVYASFIEPTAAPNSSDQDFTQNILGANNADNDFSSSAVVANKDGSIIERAEYIANRITTQGEWYPTECGESTTSTQTTCYVDDTARYLTTDLCNEAKENSCFVPTDNSYYAFGSECADSTTTTKTNCYVDDTAKYVDTNACVNSADTGYCYMNTATFPAMDADLTAANIAAGKTIFGVAGTATVYGVYTDPRHWQYNEGLDADADNRASTATCFCQHYGYAGYYTYVVGSQSYGTFYHSTATSPCSWGYHINETHYNFSIIICY